jgi:hypothetical protein
MKCPYAPVNCTLEVTYQCVYCGYYLVHARVQYYHERYKDATVIITGGDPK